MKIPYHDYRISDEGAGAILHNVGLRKRQDTDCYLESQDVLKPAMEQYREALLKGKSRSTRKSLVVLVHTDYAALCAFSPEQLQDLLNCFADTCDKSGLTTSLKKKVTMSQSNDFMISP